MLFSACVSPFLLLSAVPHGGQVVVSHVQASTEGKRDREGLSESKSQSYKLELVCPQI